MFLPYFMILRRACIHTTRFNISDQLLDLIDRLFVWLSLLIRIWTHIVVFIVFGPTTVYDQAYSELGFVVLYGLFVRFGVELTCGDRILKTT